MVSRESVPPEQLYVPDHVHPLIHDGGAVILNSETGECHKGLNREGSALLRIVNEEGSIEAVIDYFQAAYPELTEKNVTTLAGLWVKGMSERGLIAEGVASSPNTFAIATPFTEEELLQAGDIAMTLSDIENLTLTPQERQAATDGLADALEFIELPFQEMVVKIRQARLLAEREATEKEAKRDMAAIHQVSARYMGRFACLGVAIGAVLTSAYLGRSVGLKLGAKTDPNAFHAWPTVGTTPIRLETDEAIIGQYYPLFDI